MKPVLPLVFLALFLSIYSCKGPVENNNSQMETVVAVHDELMPKMVEITRLQEQLTSALPDSVRTKEQSKTIDDLGLAHDAMMSWMRDFGQAFDFEEITQGKPLTEAKKDSLNKYEQSVLELQDQMLTAISNGQEAFDALKKQ